MAKKTEHRFIDPRTNADSILVSCYGDLRKGAFLRRRSAYRSHDKNASATRGGVDSGNPGKVAAKTG